MSWQGSRSQWPVTSWRAGCRFPVTGASLRRASPRAWTGRDAVTLAGRLKAFVLVAAALGGGLWLFHEPLLAWLGTVPQVKPALDFIAADVRARGYAGFAVLCFVAASCSCGSCPAPGCSSTSTTNPLLDDPGVVAFAALGTFSAMVVNYVIGFTVVRLFLFVSRRDGTSSLSVRLQRWGGLLIVGGYLVPVGFPSGVLAMVAGIVRFRFGTFLWTTALGCTLHFLLLRVIVTRTGLLEGVTW